MRKRRAGAQRFARTNCTEGDSPAAHRLAERMFYHNPKDNSGAGGGGGQLDSGDGGAHWISHTHGALLAPGESVFTGYSKDDDDAAEAIMHQLAHDNLFRNDFINQQCNSTFADCGHVIPNSSLERYFFSVFDIHHVDVFNPSE